MDNASKEEYGVGDIGYVPPEHNTWVVGDELLKALDITGVETYVKE